MTLPDKAWLVNFCRKEAAYQNRSKENGSRLGSHSGERSELPDGCEDGEKKNIHHGPASDLVNDSVNRIPLAAHLRLAMQKKDPGKGGKFQEWDDETGEEDNPGNEGKSRLIEFMDSSNDSQGLHLANN